ncbi:MAG: endonuclease/exonuclease/phosphatase family protein [Microbacteriaceae bacterium]|nr:endonuclease/exonuclease/phosphatase family protein [Microbacteriaceae bacterium]MCL2795259.1 endonuclease/exonuclease/phosphatase family protein [Microbacteriaceae bacterium]
MPALRLTRLLGDAFLGALALAIGALLLWHRAIPDTGGVMGLVESVLPWFGLPVVVLGIVGIARRSAFIGIGVMASVVIWLAVFLPRIVPHAADGTPEFTVVSQNINADNTDPRRTIEALEAQHPQVIALQELTASSAQIASATLDARYPHHYLVGTVGVWSTLPLAHEQSLTLGLGWKRALRVDVQTGAGDIRLYALHAASLRPGEFVQRDTMLRTLASTLRADGSKRLIAVGDFNAASTDRAFTQLLNTVHEPDLTGWGFGFTWPATLPIARVDHVLERGLDVVENRTLPGSGSDHRAVEAGVR